MRSSRCGGVVAGTVVAVAVVGLIGGRPALATSQKTQAVDLGQKLYTQYCASCHGADGKGNGPAAAKLNPKPTDLTQLAKRNGGKFPFYETMLSIEGRSPTGQDENTDLPGRRDGARRREDAGVGRGLLARGAVEGHRRWICNCRRRERS